MASASELDPVSTRCQRIAELAKEAPQRGLTSLAHHIDLRWLYEAYCRTRADGATGVDGQTAAGYAAHLGDNLRSLLERAKSGTYRAPPVRRVHIPKGNGPETRPIGIPMIRAYCTPFREPWDRALAGGPAPPRSACACRHDCRPPAYLVTFTSTTGSASGAAPASALAR